MLGQDTQVKSHRLQLTPAIDTIFITVLIEFQQLENQRDFNHSLILLFLKVQKQANIDKLEMQYLRFWLNQLVKALVAT